MARTADPLPPWFESGDHLQNVRALSELDDSSLKQSGVVLLISAGQIKAYGFQKKFFQLLGLFLTTGLILLLGPEALPAQTKSQSTDQFQRLGVTEVPKKLVSIESVTMADLLTVHLDFDGQIPLHNAFILSNPPRFVIEFLNAGSALDEAIVILKDTRVKQIQTQRHRMVFHISSKKKNIVYPLHLKGTP
jgi:hypothetical protein